MQRRKKVGLQVALNLHTSGFSLRSIHVLTWLCQSWEKRTLSAAWKYGDTTELGPWHTWEHLSLPRNGLGEDIFIKTCKIGRTIALRRTVARIERDNIHKTSMVLPDTLSIYSIKTIIILLSTNNLGYWPI